jgi:hypothetical protein
MQKDVTFSMRMSKRMRGALTLVARKERRSVSSLLDKIISEYLEKQGLSLGITDERREHPRKKMNLPSTTFFESVEGPTRVPSVVLDFSKGGVLVSFPKGSSIPFGSSRELPKFGLCFEIPSTGEEIRLNCAARRISDVGDEIQVGAMFEGGKADKIDKLGSYLM